MTVRPDALPELFAQPTRTRVGLSGPELQNAMISGQEAAFSRIAPNRPAGPAGSVEAQIPVPSLLEVAMGRRAELLPEDDALTPPGVPAPSEVSETGGFFKQLGDLLANPNAQKLLSQIGMSLTAREPDSFGFQLNQFAGQNAEDVLTAQALQKALAGEDLAAEDLAGLSAEQRQQVLGVREQISAEGARDRQIDQGDRRLGQGDRQLDQAQSQIELARQGQDFDQQLAQDEFDEEIRQFDEQIRQQGRQLDISSMNAQANKISAGASALRAQTDAMLGEVQKRLGDLELLQEEGELLGISPGAQRQQFQDLSEAGAQLGRVVQSMSSGIEALTEAKLIAQTDEEKKEIESAITGLKQNQASATENLKGLYRVQAELLNAEEPTRAIQVKAGESMTDSPAYKSLKPGQPFILYEEGQAPRWVFKSENEEEDGQE